MLRELRKYSSSVGVRVLYGLLALTFVAWGAGTVGLNRLNVIAEVHGQRITNVDVDRETALLEQQFRRLMQGADLPTDINFRGQALDALVTDALVRHEADRLGLGVSDDEVIATITEMPELQRDGRFDRDLLERFLDVQRDRGEFESEVRRRILADRVRALVVDGVRPSDAEIREEYERSFASVRLAFVRIDANAAGAALEVTDEVLDAFRTANPEGYLGPPRSRARYVVFTPDEYLEAATPSASEIERHYEAHLAAEFTRPEQVKARHVLVRVAPDASDEDRTAARARAEDLRAQIAAGAAFAEIATEHSDDTGSGAQGGDLGWFARGRMTPAFEAVAFDLEPGVLSEVVETPFGFHLIEVEAHDPGGPQELAAVRDTIVQTLSQRRALELARNAADATRRAIVDGQSLAEAAGDRPVHETEPFSRGSLVPELGAAPTFNETAFTLGEGETSDLVEESSGIYILSPFGRTERELPPLDEIRVRVEADYRREKGAEAARETAERLLARAREVGLVAAAEEAGRTVEETPSFSRRDGGIPELEGVPGLADVVSSLDMAAPLAPEVLVAGRDALVVALAERVPADPVGFEAERATLATSLRERRRTEVFGRYLDLLKQRALDRGVLKVPADAFG